MPRSVTGRDESLFYGRCIGRSTIMRPICVSCNQRPGEVLNSKKGTYRNLCWYCHQVKPDPKAFYDKKRGLTRRKKREVMDGYGGKCACCGETELAFLTIDHIDGGGCKHRRSLNMGAGVQFYRKLLREGCPSGYQVLCFNCNMGRAVNGGVCPHHAPTTDELPLLPNRPWSAT